MTRRTTIDEARSVKTWTYLTPSEDRYLRAFAETLDVSVSTVLRALVQKAIFDSPAPIGAPPAAQIPEVCPSHGASCPSYRAEPVSEPLPPGSDWAGHGFSGDVPMPPWERSAAH